MTIAILFLLRLQARVSALHETTVQLRELIQQLETLDFQPGFVPLDLDEDNSESGELSADIRKLLREGVENQALLVEEVEYFQPDGADKAKLKEAVDKAGKELKSCRFGYRKAKLAANKNLAVARRREHEFDLQPDTQPSTVPTSPAAGGESASDITVLPRPPRNTLPHHHQRQQNQLSGLSEEEKHTVGASTNVTNALRQTHDLIQAELARSEYARETLEESSAALKQLGESYGSLDDMLKSTRQLLGTLVSSQKSDTWYLQTTFYMLAATVTWLLFRRLLYGPMWWFVWLPLRLIFGIGSTAVSSVSKGGSEQKGAEPVGSEKGQIPVDGIPGSELPTAQVGRGREEAGEQDGNAAQEEVEKIIDAVNEAEELGGLPSDQRPQMPPPADERIRDEL